MRASQLINPAIENNLSRAAMYQDRADANADSFPTKAKQKASMDALNRAYEELCDAVIKKKTILAKREDDYSDRIAIFEKYDGLPMDLHHYKPAKHAGLVFDLAEQFATLAELRHIVKNIPVIRPTNESRELAERTSRKNESIKSLMAKRHAQVNHAVSLAEQFGGLPVSCSQRHCVNQFGTHYIQNFFYLEGKITPLSVIMGALQRLKNQ